MKKINTTHKYMYGLLTNQKKKIYIYVYIDCFLSVHGCLCAFNAF